MKRILLVLSLLVSTQSYSSMLNSALFTRTKEVAQTATTKIWSCEQVKEKVCKAIVVTLEPLTTFAYDNMTLAAGTTIALAFVAYKSGKYVNMPAYRQEDVQKVVVVAQTPTARTVHHGRA